MNSTFLNHLEFDLAYLALLTRRGLKPLSRWEAAWDAATEETLTDLGLLHRRIARTAQNGRQVDELIFSRTQGSLDAYARLFNEKSLDWSSGAAFSEGLLFGYPPCCVESFLGRGYARNRLSRRDQGLLFHWACRDCRVSPQLLRHYRDVYRECKRARGLWLPDLRVGAHADAVHQRATEVGSWALRFTAMGAATLVMPQVALADLSHMLPTDGDSDADGLKDVEEAFFNTHTNVPDTDGNGWPDGYDVAHRLWQQVAALTNAATTNAPYTTDVIAKGTVRCDVCGEAVNMGFLQVVNPVEQTGVAIPFLAMHYMEHGGLAYKSVETTFDDRVDPRRADVVINNHPPPSITSGQGTFALHWHGLTGKTYQVHTTVDLSQPWTPGPTYPGADETLEHQDPADGKTNKFYRLSWW
jgi:hypothetical protein